MAYETGTATGRDDLLAKLKVFLEGDGWATNMYAADGTGYRLHVSKSGVYANLRSTNNEELVPGYEGYHCSVTGIGLNLSTGYDAGQSWITQPGYPTGNWGSVCTPLIDLPGAIPAYWFFSNGTEVDVVIEVSTSVYESLHWGELVKCGSYANGLYFSGGSDPQSCSRDAAFYDNNLLVCVDGVWEGYWASGRDLLTPWHFVGSIMPLAQTLRGVAPLLPLYVGINAGDYPLLGWPEHVRAIRMDYLDVGEEITLGSDTWVALPIKGYEHGPSGYGDFGLAIKKTT